MSDTPRTGAFIAGCEASKLSIWDALIEIQEHARKLERECASLTARLEEAEKVIAPLSQWLIELADSLHEVYGDDHPHTQEEVGAMNWVKQLRALAPDTGKK